MMAGGWLFALMRFCMAIKPPKVLEVSAQVAMRMAAPGAAGPQKWDVVKNACEAAAGHLTGAMDDEKYRGLRDWIAPLRVSLPEPK